MMGTKRQKMDFAGLRRRETYEEIINYLENEQEIIKYPNRTAKFLRDSPYLTQLDGEGQRTLEEQQLNTLKQQEKDKILREMGYKADGTVSRAERAATFDIATPPPTPTHGPGSPDDDPDFMDAESGAVQESSIRTAMRDLATGASGALSSTAKTLATGASTLAAGASEALSAGSITLRQDAKALKRILGHARQAATQAILNRGHDLADYALEVRDFYSAPFIALHGLTMSRATRQQALTGTSGPWADTARAVAQDHMTAASSSQRPIDTFEPRVQFPYPMSNPLARPTVPRSPGNFANSMTQLQDLTTAIPLPGASSKAKAKPGPRTLPGASSKAKAKPGPRERPFDINDYIT
jgi:hypothetical protein